MAVENRRHAGTALCTRHGHGYGLLTYSLMATPSTTRASASIRLSFLGVGFITLFPACSTKQIEMNLAEYPVLPSARVVEVTRCALEKTEFTRKRAFWGNYGGPGSYGGAPVDAMDEYFRQHDLAYLQGTERHQLVEADRRLISQLEALDPAELTPEADAYRLRAIRYFGRPLSRVIGKPPDVIFGWKDKPVVIDTSAVD